METKVLNYRIIITPEKHQKKIVYNAYCPTLGVADWGKSIEQAIVNIKGAIECHIESLLKNHEPIPKEDLPLYHSIQELFLKVRFEQLLNSQV